MTAGCRMWIVAMTLSLQACALFKAQEPLPDASEARALAGIERRVAMSVPGTRVCRELTVGIGQPDWIRGTVTSVDDNSIGVLIDDPGRYSQAINGIALAKGVVVRDGVLHWMPCL